MQLFHKPDKLNLKSEFNTLSPLSRRILANDEIFFGSISSIFYLFIIFVVDIYHSDPKYRNVIVI